MVEVVHWTLAKSVAKDLTPKPIKEIYLSNGATGLVSAEIDDSWNSVKVDPFVLIKSLRFLSELIEVVEDFTDEWDLGIRVYVKDGNPILLTCDQLQQSGFFVAVAPLREEDGDD